MSDRHRLSGSASRRPPGDTASDKQRGCLTDASSADDDSATDEHHEQVCDPAGLEWDDQHLWHD